MKMFIQKIADSLGGTIKSGSILPDGSGFAVISIPRRPLFHRLKHKLFDCPTFYRFRHTFICPLCGAGFRCYWDGHDSDCGAGINLCSVCANRHAGHTNGQCRTQR